MQPGAVAREAAEDNAGEHRRSGERIRCRRDRDPRRAIGRETIDAGRDGGKSNRGKAVGLAQFDGAAIARRQRLVFTPAAAVPDRADGMNHMPRRQPIAAGDFGAAGFAALEGAALGKEVGPGRAMDRTIHAATAEQRRIRGVDDSVNAQRRNVGDDDFQPRRANLARSQAQAEAAALTVTPLSASSCCSSPVWNISRMMSQPPTNSPLT
jgi:hypothetical protein